MKITNITPEQLDAALRATNRTHGYHLIWNRGPEFNAKKTIAHCTIRSIQSKIKGARTSHSGRNLCAASWHAHGHLFDMILDYAPNAVIHTGLLGERKVLKVNGIVTGNWVDAQVGSQVRPAMISDLSIGE